MVLRSLLAILCFCGQSFSTKCVFTRCRLLLMLCSDYFSYIALLFTLNAYTCSEHSITFLLCYFVGFLGIDCIITGFSIFILLYKYWALACVFTRDPEFFYVFFNVALYYRRVFSMFSFIDASESI